MTNVTAEIGIPWRDTRVDYRKASLEAIRFGAKRRCSPPASELSCSGPNQ